MVVKKTDSHGYSKRYGGRLSRKGSRVNSFETGHGGMIWSIGCGGKLTNVGWLLRCYSRAVHKHRKWLPRSGI